MFLFLALRNENHEAFEFYNAVEYYSNWHFCLAESDHSELFFGHDKAIKIAFANKSVKFFEFFLNHIIIHYPYTIVHKVNGSIVPK